MGNNKIPSDVFELSAWQLYTDYNEKAVNIKYLHGFDEDYLANEDLIRSGKVWDELWDLKVEQSDKIKLSDLYLCDRLKFMFWVRKRAYGNTVTQIVNEGNDEKIEINLNKIEFPRILSENMDENGRFELILPSSKKRIKFRPLTYKENEEAINDAKQKKRMSRLKVIPKTESIMRKTIKEVDGDSDPIVIAEFLSSIDFTPQDNLAIKKEISKILPVPNLIYRGETNLGNVIDVEVNIAGSFFFPTLFI